MAVQCKSRSPSASSQRGMSLIELMVALTIGLFLMGAVGVIYVNTATSSRASTLESQMNEDAALAIELLQQQIRLAGFSNVDVAGARRFAGRGVQGCDGGFTANDAGTAFDALICDATGTGPDALSVRYEATLLNSQNVRNAAGAPRPGNCVNESIEALAAAAEGAAIGTALADNRYYVANDATNGNTPTLFCQGRTGAGFGAATALIPNIEDMQVEYAVTALPIEGDPIPHQVAGYVTATELAALPIPVVVPPIPATRNWARVAALRICLVARSARTVPTGENTVADLGRYIDCAGEVQNPTDRFVRRAYVTTIQLRNMRPGLPADFSAGNNPWTYLYEN